MAENERRNTLWCFLLTCVCFTITAEAWIQWHRHLMTLSSPQEADAFCLVAGYLFQAAGMGVAALVARQRPSSLTPSVATAAIAGHFVCSVPASLGTGAVGTVAFGLLMCLLCGIIAAFYLQTLSVHVPSDLRGITFGGAYACSTVVTWLLALAPVTLAGGIATSLVTCMLLSTIAAVLVLRTPVVSVPSAPPPRHDAPVSHGHDPVIPLTMCAVLLMSLVKNVGFSFPSTDLIAGVSMETSRLFYAVGLIVAGLVNDRNRSWGAILCTVALVTPFALLAVAGEPVSATVLWAVDYLFYGFFSVYRVVLFADLAQQRGQMHLACLGLLFGRMGDALGTAVCQSLTGATVVLVPVAVALFAVTVLVNVRLSQLLYVPAQTPASLARSEAEVFDAFSAHYDLSMREREVLRQVLAEHTNAEAAAELYVAEATVKYHVRNLLRKTGCHNRVELLQLYTTERES